MREICSNINADAFLRRGTTKHCDDFISVAQREIGERGRETTGEKYLEYFPVAL